MAHNEVAGLKLRTKWLKQSTTNRDNTVFDILNNNIPTGIHISAFIPDVSITYQTICDIHARLVITNNQYFFPYNVNIALTLVLKSLGLIRTITHALSIYLSVVGLQYTTWASKCSTVASNVCRVQINGAESYYSHKNTINCSFFVLTITFITYISYANNPLIGLKAWERSDLSNHSNCENCYFVSENVPVLANFELLGIACK